MQDADKKSGPTLWQLAIHNGKGSFILSTLASVCMLIKEQSFDKDLLAPLAITTALSTVVSSLSGILMYRGGKFFEKYKGSSSTVETPPSTMETTENPQGTSSLKAQKPFINRTGSFFRGSSMIPATVLGLAAGGLYYKYGA